MDKTTVIKQKILGVLMRNARDRVGLDVNETADLLGITPSALTDYELGKQEAGLPVLEGLAEICHVPVSHFWSEDALPIPNRQANTAKAITLRRKMLGVLLNQARTEAGITIERAAKAIGCAPEELTQQELGQADLPLSQIEALATLYRTNLQTFLAEIEVETNGNGSAVQQPVDRPETYPADYTHFPEDVQAFLKTPSNVLYIRLAMKLHELSADTLRALAEGILEITY